MGRITEFLYFLNEEKNSNRKHLKEKYKSIEVSDCLKLRKKYRKKHKLN